MAAPAPVLQQSGRLLTVGGQPIRLVGHGDYGMLTEDPFEYRQFLDTLADQYRLNSVRVWANYHW